MLANWSFGVRHIVSAGQLDGHDTGRTKHMGLCEYSVYMSQGFSLAD